MVTPYDIINYGSRYTGQSWKHHVRILAVYGPSARYMLELYQVELKYQLRIIVL
jgi:hypothetical protein